MPVYEYRCKSCGKTHEIEHGFNDERPTACPTCGGQLVRVFHPVGVVFKGSGFHKNDYSRSGVRPGGDNAKPDKPADSGAEKKKSESKASDGKTSSDGSAPAGTAGSAKSSESKSSSKPSSGGSTA
jgi:putative FmdB family regulatory protein